MLLGTWGRCVDLRERKWQEKKTFKQWRAVWSILLAKYYSGDQIRKDEMGRACGIYGGEEKCMQGRGVWNLKDRDHWKDLGLQGRIILELRCKSVDWVYLLQDRQKWLAVVVWKPLAKRSQGRPKYRWEDNIKQDICQMIKNWIACVQDRGKWKEVVEKAKTFHH